MILYSFVFFLLFLLFPFPLLLGLPLLPLPSLMDEVILFRYPSHSSSLIIFNLPTSYATLPSPPPSLYQHFSTYGLIHSLVLDTKQIQDSFSQDPYALVPCVWAYLHYYSPYEAALAKQHTNQKEYEGRKLRVLFRTPSSSSSPSSSFNPSAVCLPFPLCVNVANYFLGFNNWSCCIIEIRRFNVDKGDEDIESGRDVDREALHWAKDHGYGDSYVAVVEVYVKENPPLRASGVSHRIRREGEDMSDSYEGKKKAVSFAYKEIFNSLAIVRLKEGNTHVIPIV